jgi:lysophospholipase L1-like esterase
MSPLRSSLLAFVAACTTAGACAQAPRPVRIELFGDSTQWGYDGRTERQVPHPPAQVLQALMDARFGTGRVVVTERAVPGTTAGELLAGKDGRNRPWPQEVDADIVVVNHALNDANTHVPLRRYAETLARLHATVYETPNPVTVAWNWAPYADAMRRVAADQHAPVADVARWMLARPRWQATLVDGVHPDDATYGAIVREVLMPVLAPLVDEALAARPAGERAFTPSGTPSSPARATPR